MAVGGAGGPQGPGGVNGQTPVVEVDENLELPTSVAPVQGGETADSYVSGGVPDVAGGLTTQPGNPVLTMQTSADSRAADISGVLQSAREGDSDAIYALIEAAKVDTQAAWALAHLATARYELFDTGHISGMIEAAKVYEGAAQALEYLTIARPKLFVIKHIPSMIEAARGDERVTWELAYLARERSELAPLIIPSMIEEAKVNEGIKRELAYLAATKPDLAPLISRGLAVVRQLATVQVGDVSPIGVSVGGAEDVNEVAVGPSVVPSSEVTVGPSPEQQAGNLTVGAAAMAGGEIAVPAASAADAAAKAAEATVPALKKP